MVLHFLYQRTAYFSERYSCYVGPSARTSDNVHMRWSTCDSHWVAHLRGKPSSHAGDCAQHDTMDICKFSYRLLSARAGKRPSHEILQSCSMRRHVRLGHMRSCFPNFLCSPAGFSVSSGAVPSPAFASSGSTSEHCSDDGSYS